MSQGFSFRRILAVGVLALTISTVAIAQTPFAKAAGGDAKSSTPLAGKPVDRPEEALTAAQLAKIKSVLAPYKAARVTADDAKLIKRTLRDAGYTTEPRVRRRLAGNRFRLAPPGYAGSAARWQSTRVASQHDTCCIA